MSERRMARSFGRGWLALAAAALAGCGGADVKDDPPSVRASVADPPSGVAQEPPLGKPRAKLSPSTAEDRARGREK